MACMHKETFEIYYNDLRIVPDGYVEIDELIAPAIQVLNRKGYTTIGCCSGHPLKGTISPISSEMGHEIIHDRVYCTHVIFGEGISLPTLPFGFIMDSKPIYPPDFFINNPPDEYVTLESIKEFLGLKRSVLFIRKSVCDGYDFFATSRNILETTEQLYKWALDLPDFKDE